MGRFARRKEIAMKSRAISTAVLSAVLTAALMRRVRARAAARTPVAKLTDLEGNVLVSRAMRWSPAANDQRLRRHARRHHGRSQGHDQLRRRLRRAPQGKRALHGAVGRLRRAVARSSARAGGRRHRRRHRRRGRGRGGRGGLGATGAIVIAAGSAVVGRRRLRDLQERTTSARTDRHRTPNRRRESGACGLHVLLVCSLSSCCWRRCTRRATGRCRCCCSSSRRSASCSSLARAACRARRCLACRARCASRIGVLLVYPLVQLVPLPDVALARASRARASTPRCSSASPARARPCAIRAISVVSVGDRSRLARAAAAARLPLRGAVARAGAGRAAAAGDGDLRGRRGAPRPAAGARRPRFDLLLAERYRVRHGDRAPSSITTTSRRCSR